MNNSLSKNKNGGMVRNIEKEIEEVINDAVEDIAYRNATAEKATISIVLESEACKVFSDESRWETLFSIGWSNYFIDKINSGMIGLVLERMFDEEDDVKDVFGYFVKKANKVFLKRKKLLKMFSDKTCDELYELYGNKYSFVNAENITFRFNYDAEKSIYVPSLKVRIKVKRDK